MYDVVASINPSSFNFHQVHHWNSKFCYYLGNKIHLPVITGQDNSQSKNIQKYEFIKLTRKKSLVLITEHFNSILLC